MLYYRKCPDCNKKITYTVFKNFKNSKDKNRLCQCCASKKGRIIYLTKDKCKELALLCNTRVEFGRKYNGAYNKSRKNGWLDEICSHMIKLGNMFKRCIYAYEFHDKSVYVGLTCNLIRRDLVHNSNNKSLVFRYIKKTKHKPIIKKLTDYVDKDKASRLECDIINEYRNKGWKIINKNKAGALGSSLLKWTKEKCLEAVLKCKTRKEFIVKYSGARLSALRNGWLDEMYSHLEKIMKPKNYWTKKTCLKEALKYKNKKQFRKKSISAYNMSNRNGWMDEICKHMVVKNTQKGYWTKKRCKEASIKYHNRTTFHNKEAGAFKASNKNNWLDEFYPIKHNRK